MEKIICPVCSYDIPEGYCCWIVNGRFCCSEKCARQAAGV